MSAVYIHIPFCLRKCPYCSFSSYICAESLQLPYVDAVLREIELWRGMGVVAVSTMFFGGGTPTIFPAELLVKIIEKVVCEFGIEQGAEVSLEANPGTVNLSSLKTLRDSGVNRLSFGVQSFDDRELKILGRIHDSRVAVKAVQAANRAGFSNINIDLMYGVPGQSLQSWRSNLEMALSLQPCHLSMYQLTLEEGTPFASWYHEGKFDLPDEDEIVAMESLTQELCERHGLFQYEISNWARTGYRCRHNIIYWHNEPYVGIGAGAVSYWRGTRKRRVESPEQYIEAVLAGSGFIYETEKLNNEETFRETVIMGLRLLEGINLKKLQERFGIDLKSYYGDTLSWLKREHLITITDTRLRLTQKGRALANRVLAELV